MGPLGPRRWPLSFPTGMLFQFGGVRHAMALTKSHEMLAGFTSKRAKSARNRDAMRIRGWSAMKKSRVTSYPCLVVWALLVSACTHDLGTAQGVVEEFLDQHYVKI